MSLDLYPLREEELMLKQYFSDNGITTFSKPLDYDTFKELIIDSPIGKDNSFSEKISYMIEEEQFFMNQMDIDIFLHMRYLPPYLHKSDFFELSYVLDGEFTYYVSNQSFSMKKGDIVILAPNITHCSYTASDNGIQINILIRASTFENHFISLIPRDDLLHSFFMNALYSSSGGYFLEFITGDDTDLIKMILSLYDESIHNHRYKNTMLTSLLSSFFVLLIRKHENHVWLPGLCKGNLGENAIMMIEYMQKNYANVTLHYLANFFNYSDRQAQRIILSATGKTFKDNITELKMGHASKLLLETTKPIYEIAIELGFFDDSHFRRAFSSFYKMSPSAYRKELSK